jgi:hypothetical protein
MMLNRSGDYLAGGDHSMTCVGNLDKCRNGLTISMWIYFIQLRHGAYYLDTGNNGLRMFYADQRMTISATTGLQQWTVSMFHTIFIIVWV